MLQQQNEVLIQQQYILERSMYRLDPAPPKLPPQEYINRYFDENDEKYLLWYLHDQEPMLNKVAQSACERYAMTEHFADMKQAVVFGIWTALQKYDATVGTPFTVFQKRYISDSIEEYIRTAQSGVVTMTTDTYPVMKRIMAIYHQNGGFHIRKAAANRADHLLTQLVARFVKPRGIYKNKLLGPAVAHAQNFVAGCLRLVRNNGNLLPNRPVY